jgi:hypothetical protein
MQLVPSAAEAPTHLDEQYTFATVGKSGFSYRWSSENTQKTKECQLYNWCVFADVVGPACKGEVLIELEFYDKNGDLVTGGGDVIAGQGRQRHLAIELGTNRDITFSTLNVVDVWCGAGLPTGNSAL